MKTIVFDDDLTTESVTKLIYQIEDSQTSEIFLKFSSMGGDLQSAEMLLEYLGHCDYTSGIGKKIRLIAFNHLASSAFYLFFKANAIIKKILIGTVGEIHVPGISVHTRNLLDKTSVSSMQVKDIANMVSEWLLWYKNLGFNESEITRLKKGKSLFIDKKRLDQILKVHEPYQYKYINEKNSKVSGS